MLNILRACLMTIVAVFIFSGGAQAMETLSSDQLTPGMQGYAKTVIEGDRIESFSVEIVGVMDDDRESEGKIIARVSGDVIEKTGGVLQGMSGSPVYIEGKLIGAISGGWKDVDNKTCLITPINDMLKIWTLPDEKHKRPQNKINLRVPAVTKEENENTEAKTTKAVAAESKEQPLFAPLMVSGFGEAGMRLLEEKLQPLSLTPYMAGSGGSQAKYVQLEPGSSVGVQLVRGDITMAAIGTVTAVENGRVLAFGHPFLRKGNVNYFMTDAQIITTANGETSGFKVGVPGNLVGRISQDRSAAVAGVMGRYPSVVPLKVTVEDAQLKSKKSYDMQVAYDEELMATLIPTMVYNAMDKARDRLGYGTAQVAFEIMTDSIPGGTFKRDNMFYNPQDVGQVAVAELLQTLNFLAINDTQESGIFSVKVSVKIDERKNTASLLEVMPDRASIKAGETVNLKIKMKPYRKNEEIFIVPYRVPKNQKPGMLNLEVRGGGLVPAIQVLLQQQGVDLMPQEDKLKPFGVKLEELAKSDKNNEIVIGPAPMIPMGADQSIAAAGADKDKKKNKDERLPEKAAKSKAPQSIEENAVVKHSTDYIIDNVLPVFIQIEAEEGK